METDAKIAALREAAERKRRDALNKVNQAITLLVKKGQPISFPAVAKAAGVSVAYLYKYEELKERIKHLQQQQQETRKSAQPQLASDKSKLAIIQQLKERIRKLEAENRGLRTQNETIYGNLSQLMGIEQQVERLRAENTRLRNQLDECCRHHSQSQSSATQSHELKVTSLADKPSKQSGISDRVKSELESLGIVLNTTLTKKIKSVSEAVVLKAVESLKGAMASGEVKNRAGFLVRALEGCWQSNEDDARKSELETFKAWYSLAKKRGLILASQAMKQGIEIYTVDEQWIPFQKMLLLYPLETLKSLEQETD